MMTAKPKAFNGWAIIAPGNRVVMSTITTSPSASWAAFYCADITRRRVVKRIGYRVGKVSVTLDTTTDGK